MSSSMTDESRSLFEDEGYSSDDSTASTIPPSIWIGEDFQGRRYHAFHAEKYPFPDDEDEWARLKILHDVWLAALQGSHVLAPLIDSQLLAVLDIGFGTGDWAINFAQQYPNALVTGIDLSPPRFIWGTPNLDIVISDFDDRWPRQKYDFIHSRMLAGSIRDVDDLVRNCFHGLNPDGFIEMQDTLPFACDDGSWTGSSLEDWNSLMQSAARQRGTDLAIALRYESAMKSAGFQDVSLHIRKLPVNTWPKDSAFHWIGKRLKRSMLIGLSGMSLKLLRQELNMREDEYQVLLAGVRKDLCDHKIHAYLPIVVVYGRRPAAGTVGEA
ncbi:hypothetical protein LTS08_008752 [Lithohypha guttulata]|nr:hypothetical protein LTS08_008752 [Lithohypha guttulata]